MLWESSKMEQRYDAVLGVIRDGFSVTEVAQKFGVSRQAVHTWLKRYEEGGLGALGERSHRPSVSPNQMPAVIEARTRTAPTPPELGSGESPAPAGARGRDAPALRVGDLPRAATKRPHRREGSAQAAADL